LANRSFLKPKSEREVLTGRYFKLEAGKAWAEWKPAFGRHPLS